jgi:hypothetical protein
MELEQYDMEEHRYTDMYTVIINTEEISSIEEFFPNDVQYDKTALTKIIMNNGKEYITDDDIDELKKDIEESEMISEKTETEERLDEICGILAQIRDAIEKIG